LGFFAAGSDSGAFGAGAFLLLACFFAGLALVCFALDASETGLDPTFPATGFAFEANPANLARPTSDLQWRYKAIKAIHT